jgi:hypothetical protein
MSADEDILFALLASVEQLTLPAPLTLSRIAWPNKSFITPGDGGPYLEVRVFPNRNTRRFLGSNEPYYRRGIMTLNYISQTNEGPSAVTAAGQIAQQYPMDRKLPISGGNNVQVTSVDVGPSVQSPENTNWLTPVSVYYELFA